MTAPLSPRERIFKTLAFEEADIVPYHLMIDAGVRLRLVEFLEDENFDRRICNHLPFYNLEPSVRWTSADTYIDAFGSGWRTGLAPHLESAPLSEPDLKGYPFPDLCSDDYFQGVDEFLNQHAQHFTLCGIAHGFFDRGWGLRGMEAFLSDFITAPAFVEELFETLTGIYIRLLERIAAYPFDGIRFGDDWGYQRGVLIGAGRWRKFVKPGLKRIFGRARELGLVVMVHSDGDVSELIPDLIEMGVQILNPVQPEAMNVVQIKREYGREICLNGGISTQLTLPQGTPQEVRAEVLACLQVLGANGGYIASPAKSLMADVPLVNAAALIDALVDQPADSIPTLTEHSQTLERVFTAFHPGLNLAGLPVEGGR